MRISSFLALTLIAFTTLAQAAEFNTVTVYKSPTCGCCEKYIEYLKQNGVEVSVTDVEDTAAVKAKYDVPAALESCHTSLANGYVIEGHVPVAAIRKLLSEGKPIRAIALPGMSVNAPGMGPMKLGTLTIYEIPKSGETPRV